jgi:hypothetical protein
MLLALLRPHEVPVAQRSGREGHRETVRKASRRSNLLLKQGIASQSALAMTCQERGSPC